MRRGETDENANMRAALRALPKMIIPIESGQFIYLGTDIAEPGADCWTWLQNFVRVAYTLIKASRLHEVRIILTYERQESYDGN